MHLVGVRNSKNHVKNNGNRKTDRSQSFHFRFFGFKKRLAFLDKHGFIEHGFIDLKLDSFPRHLPSNTCFASFKQHFRTKNVHRDSCYKI